MRALIVDDEPRARRELRRLLAAHPEIELVARLKGGRVVTLSRRQSAVFRKRGKL